MSTVLVTGGTGFIGRHLVPELLDDGFQVEVLTRNVKNAQEVLPEGVVSIASLAEAREPHAVVNLAGENLAAGRWTEARKREMRESRLRVTRELIDFVGRCEVPPGVFISGSAVGFYGARGADAVTEETPAGDEFQSRLCSDWEAEAMRASDECGVRVCLLRTGIVLGADDGALAQMLVPFRLGFGGPFSNGRQYMSWIHIRDEIGAIRFLLQNESCRGPFNLTAPNPVTNERFARLLGKALNRPTVFRVPGSVLRLAMGEMSRLVLTGQRAVPEGLEAAGYVFEFSELDTALEDLVGQ